MSEQRRRGMASLAIRQGKGSAMAWRRLLCVGFGAGFLSISQGALSVENAPPVADAELMPDDQVGESNAPKTFSHVELNLALVKADSSTRSEFQSYRRERKIGQVASSLVARACFRVE